MTPEQLQAIRARAAACTDAGTCDSRLLLAEVDRLRALLDQQQDDGR